MIPSLANRSALVRAEDVRDKALADALADADADAWALADAVYEKTCAEAENNKGK